MKVGVIAMLAAAWIVISSIGPADATMYVDSDERRSTLFGTFLLISVMVGALVIISAFMARSTVGNEPEIDPSSMVVPQIKQESNIVRPIMTA